MQRVLRLKTVSRSSRLDWFRGAHKCNVLFPYTYVWFVHRKLHSSGMGKTERRNFGVILLKLPQVRFCRGGEVVGESKASSPSAPEHARVGQIRKPYSLVPLKTDPRKHKATRRKGHPWNPVFRRTTIIWNSGEFHPFGTGFYFYVGF